MPEIQDRPTSDQPAQPYRMDVQLHELLTKPAAKPQVHPAPEGARGPSS